MHAFGACKKALVWYYAIDYNTRIVNCQQSTKNNAIVFILLQWILYPARIKNFDEYMIFVLVKGGTIVMDPKNWTSP